MITLLMLVRNVAGGLPLQARSFAPFAASGALGAVLIAPLGPVAGLFLSAATYLTVVALLKGIRRDDLRVVRRLLLSMSNKQTGT